jgi:hypothetical protein
MGLDNIKIDIDPELGLNPFVFAFNAKYADSVYNGFHYRNGRQHADYDYVSAALANEINLPARLAANMAKYKTLKGAYNATARELRQAFINQLSENKSGMNTLNWWHDDHDPSQSVEVVKGG